MASAIPENRAPFSLAEVARVTGGKLIGANAECVGVSTDSRADLRGRLFVALRGERFDGHDFVALAAQNGALGAVVEHPISAASLALVQVSSTLDALGALAAEHRRRWGGRVVAVAGSAGKTTTRSAISAVLNQVSPGALHFAAGNLNNLIGVPMVLFGLEKAHALGVVEIGTNAPGEVRALSRMANPNLALLTLIGIEHSEGLGDLDGIEREEGEIWAGLAAGGVAVFNADDERVARTVRNARVQRALSYGAANDADYRLVSRSAATNGGSRLQIERRTAYANDSITIETPLLGNPGAYAALAALAAGEWATGRALEPSLVSRALAVSGEPGRLTSIELADGTVVLDDSYNSNPASVTSSVSTAREVADARAARLVLVIGEMRELGALSQAQHREVGAMLSQSGASLLVAVMGDAALFLPLAERAGLAAVFAENAENALALLLPELEPRDVVLVKASRGVHAERLVRGLVEAKGRAA
ncbi:MAG TPA: UDP-N-acetylmuramoyl-tripeptide--D-alanyl-D-alanine ligase [Polyangiaceae bacterium]|jgi:UDP-N-acetylmuramoyl-tripeptide--D-alanyl-D-alanine ligase|nr:UDP-N-acetylmuramoyl-tripeptide--D-alanyl-D-alanine ligase [Polyangiaceae bacterium]